MSLVEANWHPTSRQLRQFGLACAVALPLVGWIWSAGGNTIGILATVGTSIAGLAFVFPRAVTPIFIGLMLVTMPIGLVVGELAMFLIYIVVFLPIGLVFRLRRRDRLKIKLERQAKSYWQPKEKPKSVGSYYHQS